jgi:hypothetical protein
VPELELEVEAEWQAGQQRPDEPGVGQEPDGLERGAPSVARAAGPQEQMRLLDRRLDGGRSGGQCDRDQNLAVSRSTNSTPPGPTSGYAK